MKRPYLWLLAFVASFITIASSIIFNPNAIARDINYPIQMDFVDVDITNTNQNVFNETLISPSFSESIQISSAKGFLRFPFLKKYRISSLFGLRIHPKSGKRRPHRGIDIAAPLGTSVVAAKSGKVVRANWWGGYGNTVVLEHSQPAQKTIYAHLSRINVQSGEWVSGGQLIGKVGSTGNSTGPHLHFEVRPKRGTSWIAINPLTFLNTSLIRPQMPPKNRDKPMDYDLPDCSQLTWGPCKD